MTCIPSLGNFCKKIGGWDLSWWPKGVREFTGYQFLYTEVSSPFILLSEYWHILFYHASLYCASRMFWGFLFLFFVCLFYKLKARPSTSKMVMTHFVILAFWSRNHNISEVCLYVHLACALVVWKYFVNAVEELLLWNTHSDVEINFHDKQLRDSENVLEISERRTDTIAEGPGLPRWGNIWVQHWGRGKVHRIRSERTHRWQIAQAKREFWKYMPHSGKMDEVTVGRMAK